jgi:hypothetical protein
MTDALQTAVEAIRDRILIMQPLAVTDATYATKRWIEFRQDTPYWCNKVGGSSAPSGSDFYPTYPLNVTMRLILAYHQNVTREDDIDGNAQEKSWGYIATTLRYFEKYHLLNPPGYADTLAIDPTGCVITCPIGLDLKVLPLSKSIYLCVDFNLEVPVTVGDGE